MVSKLMKRLSIPHGAARDKIYNVDLHVYSYIPIYCYISVFTVYSPFGVNNHSTGLKEDAINIVRCPYISMYMHAYIHTFIHTHIHTYIYI